MLILLEGCDLTGKSTLAEELSRLTGAPIAPFGPPGDAPTYSAHTTWLRTFRQSDTGLIVDRCHWSDAAYGPIYHPDNVLTASEFWRIERHFRALGAVVVFCDRDAVAIKADLQTQVEADHPEVPGIYDHIEVIVERFRTIAHLSSLPIIKYTIARLSPLPIIQYDFQKQLVTPEEIIARAKAIAGAVYRSTI